MRLLVVQCLEFVVVRAETMARVNAGAQLFGRYLMMTLERSVVRSVGRSVLIEYARAGRRSMAMMWARVVMPALCCAVFD